jgi:hypothetical protein
MKRRRKNPSEIPLVRITARADGSTHLKFSDGYEMTVPPDIDIIPDPGDDFVGDVQEETHRLVDRADAYRHSHLVLIRDKNEMLRKTVVYIWKTRVAVVIRDSAPGARPGNNTMLQAVFIRQGDRVYGHLAYVYPPYRNLGLYSRVLKGLRRWFKLVLSDATLSPASARVYSRIGKFDEEHHRYRVNPAKSKVKTQHRVNAMILFHLTQSAVGEKIPMHNKPRRTL